MSEIKPLRFDSIPAALRDRPNWVAWRYQERDGKKTKVPVQFTGYPAKSNDPSTWVDFQKLIKNFRIALFAGIGFVFAPDDDLVGIDLDGCRNSETGWVAPWAKEIILKFASYAEVSPSQTGVKIFCYGTLPFSCGKKLLLKTEERYDPEKEPAIEAYDRGRYFAVTGWVLKGQTDVTDSQEALDWMKEKYWKEEPRIVVSDFRSNDAIVERARKYLQKIPPAVSGQSGHNQTFHAACVLAIDFELGEAESLGLLSEWNASCSPPWGVRDLARKVSEAMKQSGERGRLRNASPANWDRIPVRNYTAEAPPAPRECLTIVDATTRFLESVERGEQNLTTIGIPDVDFAIGGGLAFGEMVIFAGRPSNGKSAVALQCVHHWTSQGIPCAFVSEEMSSLMLGKRSMQFISPLPEEHWEMRVGDLREELAAYAAERAQCFVIEQAGTSMAAVAEIERKVADEGVRCAIVDYAQLLRSEGKGRYEQVTNTSIALRQLASRAKIILLVLCQMNREVEKRPLNGNKKRKPLMSDIKDSGQLEQDADVIAFLSWPWRSDRTTQPNKYEFDIAKNRNRPIRSEEVTCRFIPDRQMFLDASIDEFSEMGIPL